MTRNVLIRAFAIVASTVVVGAASARGRCFLPVLLGDGAAIPTPGGTTIPIPGGTPGQPGATGWRHTGITLNTTTGCNPASYISGSQYVLSGTITVDGCDFQGRSVRIRGAVTLKRSRIVYDAENDCADPAIKIESGGTGPVLIEDVEITTSDPNAVGLSGRRLDRTICFSKQAAQPVTIRRVWTHDHLRGMYVGGASNISVYDSYLGPSISPPAGLPPVKFPSTSGCPGSERAHTGAFGSNGGASFLTFSNSVLHIGYCSWASNLMAMYPESSPNHDVTITGGRFIIDDPQQWGGGGLAVGCTPGAERANYNFNVSGLQMSYATNPNFCSRGCVSGWNKLQGSNSWSNVTIYNPGQSNHGQQITQSSTAGGTPGACR